MIDPETVARYELPGHLRAVPDEIDAAGLPVTGALPPELDGRYLRNGPNPLPGERSGILQAGHGMLHGVRLRGGRAEWYRNRWVRTGAFHGRPFVTPDGRLDRAATSANTHVIGHAGHVYALVEVGLPYEVTPGLATVGPCDFGGRLTTAMTAHPKRDPGTGELHFFGYGFVPPLLTYHRLDAKGELVHSREVPVRAGTMMHDFAITEHHVVWLDLPMTFQPALAAQGMPYGWDDSHGARLGLMRHDRPGAEVTWFEIEPCWIFHVGNAHEDESGRVVLDAVRYSAAEWTALWTLLSRADAARGFAPSAAALAGRSHLHRWTLDPATGTATGQRLDDRSVEFPTIDDDLTGRRSRYLYTVTGGEPGSRERCAIVKYDTAAGARAAAYELDADTVLGEAVFAPATGGPRGEDDGWLLAVATRRDGSASRLLVLDAARVEGGPVAAVELPRAVPTGFHGSWLPEPA
ncbi:carotenoid oxygenase family protein [Actinomadura sp. ATCC 31491]|uniref:Dioxygenase n=1 Tax=Actinomadura luzonensis TaxID=2805427 RepID=A0ABT0FVH0_9ACTN|nr:carotenoid oxygenase family protein [Actinomadura luzonensis]MCK2215926.1 carotenoid oxygenase family protein [Actinomadura luzonensis]